MKHFLLLSLLLVFIWGMAQGAPQGVVPVETPDSLPAAPSIPSRLPDTPSSTPVDIDDHKPVTVLHYYDKHGNPLDEPVMFLATLDTVSNVRSGPVYPVFNGINAGVNFGDLIFMAFGQRYASFDIWANVSLWNWIFPTLEAGLGYAHVTPARQNYTYRTPASFYAKLGLNYNFLYKSNPDYQVFLGVRAGFSSFRYDVTDATIESDYWQESQTVNLRGLHSICLYGEALAGLQVKITGGFSLGWTARWHFLLHSSRDGENKPWFIPGYGGSSPFAMSVSAIWTFGPRRQQESINTSE